MSKTILQTIRLEKGMSQYELAEKSGVNYRTLQDFDQGRKSLYNAKGDMLIKLSNALEVPIESLLGSDNENRLLTYYDLFKKKTEEYRFPVVIKAPAYDASRVYPLKQKTVQALTRSLKKEKCVNRCILFGSSVSMRCHKDSDTDVAVELQKESLTKDARNHISEIIQQACDWDADIIWLDRIEKSERIYNEILKGIRLI